MPLIAPAAGASVILVFLIACNELTISALLWSAGTQTLGVAIYNLDDSGSSDLASALSVLVVLMVVCMMLLLELMAKRLAEEVVAVAKLILNHLAKDFGTGPCGRQRLFARRCGKAAFWRCSVRRAAARPRCFA